MVIGKQQSVRDLNCALVVLINVYSECIQSTYTAHSGLQSDCSAKIMQMKRSYLCGIYFGKIFVRKFLHKKINIFVVDWEREELEPSPSYIHWRKR